MAAGSADAGDLGWGTAAEERGISFRVRIEALLAVGGAIIAGGRCADAGLRIARGQGASVFYIFAGRLGGVGWPVASCRSEHRRYSRKRGRSGASAGRSPAAGAAGAVSAARSVASASAGGWLSSMGWVGSVQKTGSLVAASGWE